MRTCHYAHKPHGFLLETLRRPTGTQVVPLGLLCSQKEARTLLASCVRLGVVSKDLEFLVGLQIKFSDLPEESPWDDYTQEDAERFRIQDRFVDHFMRVYFGHSAILETIAASYRGKRVLFPPQKRE